MEHKTLDAWKAHAQVIDFASLPRTRREKLERWAHLLAQTGDQMFRTLDELEYVRPDARDAVRHNASALALAFADPVLRAAGLTADTYGAGVRFFELSEDEAHRILCSCLNGRKVAGSKAARQVRAVAHHVREKVAAGLIAAAIAAPGLVLLLH